MCGVVASQKHAVFCCDKISQSVKENRCCQLIGDKTLSSETKLTNKLFNYNLFKICYAYMSNHLCI